MLNAAAARQITSVKPGNHSPKFDAPTLQFGAYMTKRLPSPPDSAGCSMANFAKVVG
jgi:hypothetical protein